MTGAEIEKPLAIVVVGGQAAGNRGGWRTGDAPDQDRDSPNGLRVGRAPRHPKG